MEFITPNNLNDLLGAVARHPNYTILAGGTDICVLMNSGKLKPEVIVNIWGLDELRGITEQKDHIEIGALTTHREILSNITVRKHLPALAEACATIGAVQIQNRGTIGGNVMNGSPAGDSLPVLLAYDAEVEASSVDGNRRISFAEFYKGYRKTALKENEVVTRFKIPKTGAGEKSMFIKIGQRNAQAISKVMGCFRARMEKNTIKESAVAFGSVAPVPIRLMKTEKYLQGKAVSAGLIDGSVKSVSSEVSPIDDIRSNAEYRRHICGVFIKRFLTSLQAS